MAFLLRAVPQDPRHGFRNIFATAVLSNCQLALATLSAAPTAADRALAAAGGSVPLPLAEPHRLQTISNELVISNEPVLDLLRDADVVARLAPWRYRCWP
jgi:hypothetical protein